MNVDTVFHRLPVKITGASLHSQFLLLGSNEYSQVKFVDRLQGKHKAMLARYWVSIGREDLRQIYFKGV